MVATVSLILALIYLRGTAVGQSSGDPFTFCNDNKCEDCPVAVTSLGTGFPNCVVYNSKDVFANTDVPGSDDGGGYRPYINVNQPDQDCKIIIKSPASTTLTGCGFPLAAYDKAVCGAEVLEETFMVQFCCGSGDCNAAFNISSDESLELVSTQSFREQGLESFSYGIQLTHKNGTVIPPAQIGSPPSNLGDSEVEKTQIQRLSKRSKCEKDSWRPNPGQESYTRPADGTQIVKQGVQGEATVEISHERTSTWSTSIETSAGLSFEDIFSMSLTITQTFEKSITDTSTRSFVVPEGQKGDIGFTPFLMCTTGTGKCNDQDVSGEVCSPYKVADELAGQYAVMATS